MNNLRFVVIELTEQAVRIEEKINHIPISERKPVYKRLRRLKEIIRTIEVLDTINKSGKKEMKNEQNIPK